jgi:hypothetical protein
VKGTPRWASTGDVAGLGENLERKELHDKVPGHSAPQRPLATRAGSSSVQWSRATACHVIHKLEPADLVLRLSGPIRAATLST